MLAIERRPWVDDGDHEKSNRDHAEQHDTRPTDVSHRTVPEVGLRTNGDCDLWISLYALRAISGEYQVQGLKKGIRPNIGQLDLSPFHNPKNTKHTKDEPAPSCGSRWSSRSVDGELTRLRRRCRCARSSSCSWKCSAGFGISPESRLGLSNSQPRPVGLLSGNARRHIPNMSARRAKPRLRVNARSAPYPFLHRIRGLDRPSG